MPGFISMLASGVVHLIVIMFMIWSAGQMLDSGVKQLKGRLDQENLLAAAALLLMPDEAKTEAKQDKPPEPAEKPAEKPPAEKPPAKKIESQSREPAPAEKPVLPDPPAAAPAAQLQPATEPPAPVEYLGRPLTGDAEKPDPELESFERLGLLDGRDGQLHVEAPFGQQSSHVSLEGQRAPALKVSFGAGVLEHLLRTGAAGVFCNPTERGQPALQLRGTLSNPDSWAPVSDTVTSRMSMRNMPVPEPRCDTAEVRLKLEEMGLTSREARAAALKIWFSNELDQYLLRTQLNVVRDQPETEWMKFQTHVFLVFDGGEVVAKARLLR
ncbi:MAG: hypothetical protein ACKO3T_23325 [Planctomycetaceae bacterium]